MKTTAYTVEITKVDEPDVAIGVKSFVRKGDAQRAANAVASNGAVAEIKKATIEGKPAEILSRGLAGELDEMCEFALVATYRPGERLEDLFSGASAGYLVEVENVSTLDDE